MNTLESCFIVSPKNNNDECAKFVIDDTGSPFILSEIMQVGNRYTLSLWIKSEANSNIKTCDKTFSSTTTWQKHSVVFISTSKDLTIEFLNPGTYYIYHPKLEIGNMATDWSPAPEDVEDKFISTLDGYYTKEETEAAIDVMSDEINLTVSSMFENMKVGARNLIRNSDDLIYDDYDFGEASLIVLHDGDGNADVISNVISASVDDIGNAVLDAPIMAVSEDGSGNVVLASALDQTTDETVPMKTVTIGGIKFEVVDEYARNMISSTNELIGDLEDLITEDKSNLVAAINEACTKGGGGGSSANNAVLSVTNTSGWLTKTIAEGSKCEITFTWGSTENGIETGNGVMTVYVNNAVKLTKEIVQGNNSVNVGEYLGVGSNVVRIAISDTYGNSRSIKCNVALIALSLSSTFDGSIPYTDAIYFVYTPTGNVVKNMEFWLDGTCIGTEAVSVSNRQMSFTIPKQSHGAHLFEVFCTATIDEDTIESNHLRYDLICTEAGNNTPIIASAYQSANIEQYDTVKISYRVYNPASLTAVITQEDASGVIATLTVDRTEQTWSYFVDSVGSVTLTIRCGDVAKQFTFTAVESDIDVSAETKDLALYLTSYGRSNNEDNPGQWSYKDISVNFDSFNFISDGWHLDSDGITVLRVAGDARLTIPYKIFANDFRTSGKTIEIEFATRDVRNYDAVIVSCMSGGRGISITTQKAILSSEQSSIGTQYKEEEHVRLSFVVEKRANNRLLLCYINGIMSGSVQYPDNDDFSQSIPVDISIGSSDCVTDIYNIRVYDNDLTRYQILDNWIADTQISSMLKDRYTRNDIYDDYGQITIDTNKEDLPYLVIEAPVLPQFKDDKKTCSGYYIDPVNTANSFIFSGAQIDVQGTSSQYYYVKNYKIKFNGGFKLQNGTSSETYQINAQAIPTNVFTFKADVASSEGANNVVLAQLYNDLCPVKTPPQERDSRVRQTIDGHPIVIFWDNGTGPVFIGKYNFNNDKATEEVFGFAEGDESWEILQNGTDRVGWKSADFSGTDWQNDFEARYPEDNFDVTNLKALAEWLVTTNTEAATGAALPATVNYDGADYTHDTEEYRLAKFKFELADHADIDALVFYYVFTELFLCIDQREKNAFPTRFEEMLKWIMFFYDADSSLGIDNKGNLAFDYYLEDIDYTEAGDPIFNGQGSVLWVNLRNAFYDKIMAEYKRLRTTVRNDGSQKPLISYDVVNDLFESHQNKWSEAIYNEDGYRKCLEPLIKAGDGLYLPMLQGKKEQQRKWWLYNRFRYLDSKYNTGSSMETRIIIRAHAKANIKLMSYVNMYGHVFYNAEMVEHRMFRGQEYEFVWAASGAEDPVIGINDADMLTSIGDLSPLMVELVDISKATHLTSLKVGDASSNYENKNLNSITLGNNVLLKSIDLRNCTSLTQSVDASGCTGLEEAYFDGTAITGVSLPNGGNLKTLHLPGSVTSLILRNQTAITDFILPSYGNITTLWIENTPIVDPLTILDDMAVNGRVRIVGFDMTVDSADEIFAFYDKLDTMRGLDENGNNMDKPQMSGTIHVNIISSCELEALNVRYPTITIAYNTLVSYLHFYTDDGSTLLYTDTIPAGGTGMYIGAEPTKTSTAQYTYNFVGWSKTPGGSVDDDALINVVSDRKLYAVFSGTIRTYTVYFYTDNNLLQTVENVPYGGNATYMGNTPVKTGVDDPEDYIFTNFVPDGTYITGTTYCYAQYQYVGVVSRKLVQRTISGEYYNDRVTSVGQHAFHDCDKLTGVSLPAAVTINNYAFYSCGKLTTINLPSATSIGSNAFYYCAELSNINIPAVASIGTSAFESTSLTYVDLPLVTTIGNYAFRYCSNLEAIVLRSANSVCTIKSSTFNGTKIASGEGYVYVPRSLVDSYKTATYWSIYANQIRAIEDYADIVGGVQ